MALSCESAFAYRMLISMRTEDFIWTPQAEVEVKRPGEGGADEEGQSAWIDDDRCCPYSLVSSSADL